MLRSVLLITFVLFGGKIQITMSSNSASSASSFGASTAANPTMSVAPYGTAPASNAFPSSEFLGKSSALVSGAAAAICIVPLRAAVLPMSIATDADASCNGVHMIVDDCAVNPVTLLDSTTVSAPVQLSYPFPDTQNSYGIDLSSARHAIPMLSTSSLPMSCVAAVELASV